MKGGRMTFGRWDRRFFETTRGRVVALLRRRRRTVEELAQELELTDNAIRSHLATLERDGIVRQQGVRRGVGKPSYDYELTPEAEELFPKAYEPVLRELLGVLEERLGPDTTDDLLRATGRRLAASAGRPGDGASARLDAAVALLGKLGGLAEIEEADDGYLIRGYSCPLAALAPGHPEVCRLAGTLLSEYIGATVVECCDRGERPRCAFRVATPTGGDPMKAPTPA
jgi:predicted ArsR family transcriptional regulator